MVKHLSAMQETQVRSLGWLGRFPGEGNGSPLQYSCLENPMDGGAWYATVHGVAKSQTPLSEGKKKKGLIIDRLSQVILG